MAEPIDGVLAIHNALRKDIAGIDAAALDLARGKKEHIETVERFRFFNEVLVWHGIGEEMAVFPAIEAVTPFVAEAYEKDHRGLDAAYDTLVAAINANDLLAIARATAAFKFHLDIHLDKEDTHLYRIMKERIPIPDQGRIVSTMAGHIPKERFPEVVGWLFPLLNHNDRENMTLIWQMVMPPPVFDQVKVLIHSAIGDDWIELTRRIPTLK
jgi:hemerythrin-like domain-containing protein